LRNDRLPSISVKAIESLAAGLRVSPDRVAQAAIESMGYVLENEAVTTHSAIASDPRLSEPVRRVLLAAVAAAHEPTEVGGVREAVQRQKNAADDEARDP
jgi:hypothetical protein